MVEGLSTIQLLSSCRTNIGAREFIRQQIDNHREMRGRNDRVRGVAAKLTEEMAEEIGRAGKPVSRGYVRRLVVVRLTERHTAAAAADSELVGFFSEIVIAVIAKVIAAVIVILIKQYFAKKATETSDGDEIYE